MRVQKLVGLTTRVTGLEQPVLDMWEVLSVVVWFLPSEISGKALQGAWILGMRELIQRM